MMFGSENFDQIKSAFNFKTLLLPRVSKVNTKKLYFPNLFFFNTVY